MGRVDVRDPINALLVEFGAARSAEERLPKGTEIYLEITTFTGNMKKALDDRTLDANGAADPA